MSKRARKVAFSDEVQVEDDKRRREDGAEEGEEEAASGGDKAGRSECAPFRILLALALISPSDERDAVQAEAFAGQ